MIFLNPEHCIGCGDKQCSCGYAPALEKNTCPECSNLTICCCDEDQRTCPECGEPVEGDYCDCEVCDDCELPWENCVCDIDFDDEEYDGDDGWNEDDEDDEDGYERTAKWSPSHSVDPALPLDATSHSPTWSNDDTSSYSSDSGGFDSGSSSF